jgi:CheY-like chemotaxis protein
MPGTPSAYVLVADDQADLVESTVALLELHGIRAVGALGGREAIDAAAADPPAVALLDLAMPGVDGFEVARRLANQPPDRRPMLIAMTGLEADMDRQQAAEAGFTLYLTKPVPPDELVYVVRACLQARGWE